MDALLRDVRMAFRALRKHPGLIAVAALSLALGIAVNVTVFTGANAIIWRPLPYPESDRLIQVWSTNAERGWRMSASLPDFLDWRQRVQHARLAAITGASFNFAERDQPERIMGNRVSADFFPVLGAGFAVGRGFAGVDEVRGAGRVVVLSSRFFDRRFGGDSTIIDRSILLDGEPYTVLGVLDRRFKWDDNSSDVWVPLAADAGASRGTHFLDVIGRLAPGATRETLRAELAQVTRALGSEHPQTNSKLSATVVRLIDEVVDSSSHQGATISMIAVAFVLLIACANVANLLLARATGRDRELAVRSALGASRGALVRELLTESLVLAAVGGLLGLALSIVGLRWFLTIIPRDVPRVDDVRLDWVGFGYAAAITLASGILFGVAPALRSTRPNLATSLRDGSRGLTGLRHGRLLAWLVGFEVALALVLLISAGLLIKASARLSSIDPGFDPTNALAFRTSLAPKEYPDSASVVGFEEQLATRLAGLAGVKAVGAVSSLPFDGASGATYELDGSPLEREQRPLAQTRSITPGYLTAIGIRLSQGRDVAATDRLETPGVALVNAALVARHWPTETPLGKRLRMYDRWWEVVGVVQDVREFGVDDSPPAVVYLPAAQWISRRLSYVVRTTGDPAGLTAPIRAAVAALAPGQPIYSVETLATHLREEMMSFRIMPKLLTVFGVMALILAVIGVYGVMAYSVAQRTQEMGIRRALGAQSAAITGLVVRQAMLVCGIGALVGLGLAAASTKGLAFFLWGMSGFDPAVFGGVTLALLVAALAASVLPAQRAARVDPIVALRAD